MRRATRRSPLSATLLALACAGLAMPSAAAPAPATEPRPQAAAEPALRQAMAAARRSTPGTGNTAAMDLSPALQGLRRTTSVPVPQTADLARRVLLDACRRDPALRWHWLCHDGF